MLAASTLIVMGDVVEDVVDLDGKDVIVSSLSIPYSVIAAERMNKNLISSEFLRGIQQLIQ